MTTKIWSSNRNLTILIFCLKLSILFLKRGGLDPKSLRIKPRSYWQDFTVGTIWKKKKRRRIYRTPEDTDISDSLLHHWWSSFSDRAAGFVFLFFYLFKDFLFFLLFHFSCMLYDVCLLLERETKTNWRWDDVVWYKVESARACVSLLSYFPFVFFFVHPKNYTVW